MKKILFVFIILFFQKIKAQESYIVSDSIKSSSFIDKYLIDKNLNNWSIRSFVALEEQEFIVKTSTNKYQYLPNNPFSAGIGFASKKIILDLSFNIKISEENPTERYDIVWSFYKKKHLIDFYFQYYQGFEVENRNTGAIVFRNDIRSISSSFRYMHMFQESDYSIASIRSGFVKAKKSSVSMGLGGFLIHNNQSALESIIPRSYSESEIIASNDIVRKFEGTGVGALLGISTLLVLPNNFLLSLNLMPGIGWMGKRVKTLESNYEPKNPIISQIGLSMMLAYSTPNYYANLCVSNGYYTTEFNSGNDVLYGYLNAKLVFGYKLKPLLNKNQKK